MHNYTKLAIVYSVDIYAKPTICRLINNEHCHIPVMMVNLLCQIDWAVFDQILGQTLFWVFLEGVFG